eukprot:6173366-Pleurochrysis_carterae.AAC.1
MEPIRLVPSGRAGIHMIMLYRNPMLYEYGASVCDARRRAMPMSSRVKHQQASHDDSFTKGLSFCFQ